MQKVEEIYWLRAYGCIAVFVHLLDHVNQRLDNVATDLMRLPLVLGTPIFLFISVLCSQFVTLSPCRRGFLPSA